MLFVVVIVVFSCASSVDVKGNFQDDSMGGKNFRTDFSNQLGKHGTSPFFAIFSRMRLITMQESSIYIGYIFHCLK